VKILARDVSAFRALFCGGAREFWLFLNEQDRSSGDLLDAGLVLRRVIFAFLRAGFGLQIEMRAVAV